MDGTSLLSPGARAVVESCLPEASEFLTQGKSFDATKSDCAREHKHVVFCTALIWHDSNC